MNLTYGPSVWAEDGYSVCEEFETDEKGVRKSLGFVVFTPNGSKSKTMTKSAAIAKAIQWVARMSKSAEDEGPP